MTGIVTILFDRQQDKAALAQAVKGKRRPTTISAQHWATMTRGCAARLTNRQLRDLAEHCGPDFLKRIFPGLKGH